MTIQTRKNKPLWLPPLLQGDGFRLEIMEPTKENAAKLAIVSCKNFKHLKSYQPWVNETRTLQKALQFLNCDFKMFQEGVWANYSLIKNAQLEGGIRLRNWQDGTCSVSYWLTKDSQGKGLMKQALCVLEKAHFFYSTATLLLQIDPHNTPSLKRAQKSGYTQQSLLTNSFDYSLMGEESQEDSDFIFIKTQNNFLKQNIVQKKASFER